MPCHIHGRASMQVRLIVKMRLTRLRIFLILVSRQNRFETLVFQSHVGEAARCW